MTEALYSSDLGALERLSVEEVSQLFGGGGFVEIMLEPGLTVYQVAVAAEALPKG